MTQNTQLGVLLCVLGGLAGATFYLPFKGVRRWAWESYWFVYGLVALVLVPWALALTLSPNLFPVLKATRALAAGRVLPVRSNVGCRRAHLGTDDPLSGRGPGPGHRMRPVRERRHAGAPAVFGQGRRAGLDRSPGWRAWWESWSAVAGIAVTGAAGMSKERELSEEAKRQSVAEFNFPKGLAIAILSGRDERRHVLRHLGRKADRGPGPADPALHARPVGRHSGARGGAGRRGPR